MVVSQLGGFFFFQFFDVKNLLNFPLENKTFPIFFFKEMKKIVGKEKTLITTHTSLTLIYSQSPSSTALIDFGSQLSINS
jgi:hypothetical protein